MGVLEVEQEMGPTTKSSDSEPINLTTCLESTTWKAIISEVNNSAWEYLSEVLSLYSKLLGLREGSSFARRSSCLPSIITLFPSHAPEPCTSIGRLNDCKTHSENRSSQGHAWEEVCGSICSRQFGQTLLSMIAILLQ
eukprot:4155286-Amphidinium_carterae.1